MSIFITTDFSSTAAANTQIIADVRDEYISGGHRGDLQGTFPLPQGFLADRWYVGWWGIETVPGPTVFEWRLDDAGAPEWEVSAILTAARTHVGFEYFSAGVPNPHYGQPCIWRWYRQRGRRIKYRGNSEVFLYKAKDTNNHPLEVDLLSRTELLSGETITQRAIDGDALLVPRDIAAAVSVRGEVARKPGTGDSIGGMGQVTFAPYPLPSWDTSTHPNFGRACKGYCGYYGSGHPGYVHAQPQLEIEYNPGTGKLIASIEANTLASMLIEGFDILPYIGYVPEPPPPPGNEIRGNTAPDAAYNMIGEDAGPSGVGRRHAGVRFPSDVSGIVVNAKIDVLQMHQPSSYVARLFTDASAHPGSQVGGDSDVLVISDVGIKTFVWSANAPSLTPGNYWIVVSDVGGTGMMRVSVSVDQGALFGSGDDDVITNIGDEYATADYRFTVEIEPD